MAQTSATGHREIKNAFTFNIGQYLVNEINLGFEHFISENKSIEINAGIIYRNEFWLTLADDWINSQYFREHGFAIRGYRKSYKKTSDKSNNKSFYSFGFNYQYLYFNNEWIETGKTATIIVKETGDKLTGPEEILMHRLRHRLGIQLLLGNVIPAGNNVVLEFYYGLGLRGIYSNRFDVARAVTEDGTRGTVDLNYEDTRFYVRPTIHAGLKLKLGW